MLADVQLDQENNTNIQIRLLQIKHEFDEVRCRSLKAFIFFFFFFF